ncbi:MAG TPA: hypothetical protein VEX86_22820 [Longimicrobium sp.]|nr:hypothetical protein [Longimicrobium sp.]
MTRAFLLAVLLCCASPGAAQRVAMRTGSVVLPAGYTHVSFRGTDSSPGRFLRAQGGFAIEYDIGGMAGLHMGAHRRAECAWYVEHQVDGRPAYTGMVVAEGRRLIITTIMGKQDEHWSVPANFTAEARGERDVAEFMLIVGSYVPARRP